MKFLADENVPLPSALLLRHLGWDVRHIAEDCPSEKDPAKTFAGIENIVYGS
jgi:hypothetical protein